MTAPTAADIIEWSQVNFSEFGFGDEQSLQPQVDQAVAYVQWVTARDLDATMPTTLVPIAQQAVRMRTEQQVMQAQQDYIESAADDVVSSFSAGSYSETRRDQNKERVLNTWPALNEALWLLLTTSPAFPSDAVDEMREFWQMLLSGTFAPAWDVQEVDWSGMRGYGLSPYDPWMTML